ncbi:glycosyltransferase family 4 protein [Zobellia galactanivorans]|uniref:Glycosyltransferase, family GT4 n=1 Tax=Zobellia galactanivorans (strain DSM 12802 / CCUG 47099 / CIP 106680 / NCIMB 13871 / Dsij) TaxID=63186 RepID=G0L2U0_ZOBGA|nr:MULTISPECIES: glycosyltransferase family 4 protein [Zobellia]MDO6807773.1 glycosyltransferase family 4 protein [Zobellia galactanivorans]OWW25577.1 glycosyl transferase family 1 [Zobellia sp. OII3]CAZ98196.1 Glycosyltransferase, family GT4 [Zobellia galactanivorans]
MKKVLIITYYWPPAGGPGVQRWLKFVKYLRDFGIEPLVYIPENPHYPIEDATLASEVVENLTVYSQPLFEPYGIAKVFSSKKTKRISSGIIQTKNQSVFEKAMLWVRGNFFIPDARKYWVKPSVKYLSDIIAKEKLKTIITTGPPHSVHLIGRELKKLHGLQWLADFRDPWTSIGYHKELRLSKNSQKEHKALEHAVLNEADKIVVTSKTTKEEFESITKQPISVITNGYDLEHSGEVDLDKGFTISHIGSLLSGRNPENLWKVLSQIARENAVFRGDLQLEFMGVVSQDVMDTMYRYELGPYIKMRGYGSHAEALRKQQSSQLLLLVEIDSEETKGIIPGKLFEYMAAKRPILAVGPQGWEAGEIIQGTNAGKVFDYSALEPLKNTILAWYEAYKKGSIVSESVDVERFSRRALTEELSKLL